MHRFAVIGSNFVTDWLIEASREVENVELAAVYSRTEARGQEYAARHGIPRVYPSLDALAADPDIDFVYIASPNLCHAPQAIRLLEKIDSVSVIIVARGWGCWATRAARRGRRPFPVCWRRWRRTARCRVCLMARPWAGRRISTVPFLFSPLPTARG